MRGEGGKETKPEAAGHRDAVLQEREKRAVGVQKKAAQAV